MRYIISIICLLFSISVFAENWGEMTWGTGTWGEEVILPPDEDEDQDNDGMLDSWEEQYGVDDPNADEDGDGFTNLEEFQNGTNPTVPENSNTEECEDVKHAFYSFEENTVTVPIIDAPIYDLITEEPTGQFIAFYALLKFKDSPDRLSIDKIELLKNVTPDLNCHAVYREIDKTLKIPFIEVPTVAFIANQPVVLGTDIFSATLKFMPISEIFKLDSITQLPSEDK